MASVGAAGGGVCERVFDGRVESPSDGVKRRRARTIAAVAMPTGSGRPRPRRLDRLPEQYFGALLGRVAAAAADGGPPVVDLGRGNPEIGPPAHVVEALAEAARRPDSHGYAPFRGLPELRQSIARRYRDHYGAEHRSGHRGRRRAGDEGSAPRARPGPRPERRPDPAPRSALPRLHIGDRACRSGAWGSFHSTRPPAGSPTSRAAPPAAALYLNFPSNPCAVCAGPGLFEAAVDYAGRTGTAIVHDAAYNDLVFDGRKPESFLATPGAKDVGVELWTMSKTFGMAGWRLGFVLGNAEIVERVNLLGDHSRVGILAPLQQAAIAALDGPQDSVEERRAAYERRRDRLAAALPEPPVSEGTFYVWLRLPDGLTPERLLVEHRVAVAPGEGFGASGAGWARISLAVTDETLEAGIERLAPALEAAYA